MKKAINVLTLLCASIFLLVSGTGCLKDKYVDEGLAGPKINESPKIVEIMGAIEGTTSYQSSSGAFFNIGTRDTTIDLVSVRIASNDPAPEDIQVTLDTTGGFASIVQAYNDSNDTHFEAPPAGKFKFEPSNLVVTIPKGSREGTLKITGMPLDFLAGAYAFGFKIKSISNPDYKISGNFNNSFVIIGTKNQYDGIYTVTGTMVDRTNANLSGRYPMEVHLVTTGPHSVAMYSPAIHDFAHNISSSGSLSYYGSYSPEFNFDPSGNGKVVSVVNYFGQPAPNGRSGAIDPTGVNQWDPATREMKVKYFMLQPGTTIRTTFDETFQYVGPR